LRGGDVSVDVVGLVGVALVVLAPLTRAFSIFVLVVLLSDACPEPER
jgi:hypothetical protein